MREDAAGRPVRHLAFWDLLAATLAFPDPERWLPGYHDLGRTEVTPELMRARLRAFTQSFGDHGVVGSVCVDDYNPFFAQAVGIIDTACDEFVPPG